MVNSRFDIERHAVGPGWQALIEQLHADLLAIAPDYQIAQIKEKFGGLRYYVDCTPEQTWAITEQMDGLINAAEAKSVTICEVCGKPGTLQVERSWMKTLCEEHR